MRRLQKFGWGPPEGGGKHPVIRKTDGSKLVIPNPHKGDVDWSLTKRILAQAGISPHDWDQA
ncbi:MAG: type II toxin-antitoxin system HicA family toxin [Limisphaerales bacterium]